MVCDPVALGVYVTLQDPLERVQVVELKEPEPEAEKVMVPVGVPYPDTVTVHAVGVPEVTVPGEQATVVVVGEVLTFRVTLLELGPFEVSPP